MRILGISGSLRAVSSNRALLEAAQAVAPEGVQLEIYEGLAELPQFNPDLDDEGVSPRVQEWREELRRSDAVIFSTPEYAHGVPGALKNALDWVVGSGELIDKPVALFNASARGTYAQASLTETLTVMSARFIAEACVTVAREGSQSQILRTGLDTLVRHAAQASRP